MGNRLRKGNEPKVTEPESGEVGVKPSSELPKAHALFKDQKWVGGYEAGRVRAGSNASRNPGAVSQHPYQASC